MTLTDLVAVERPLELGGASGHAADGHRQHSLHQQRQSAGVLDRLHAHLQPSGVTLFERFRISSRQTAVSAAAPSELGRARV